MNLLHPLRPNQAFPVLLIPGAGGNGLGLRELAKSLPEWITPIAVHWQSRTDLQVRSGPTIQQRAFVISNEVEKLQSGRELAVYGWCFGGLVALEVARECRKRGYKVIALFIAEAKVPAPFRRRISRGALPNPGSERLTERILFIRDTFGRALRASFKIYRHKPEYLWFRLTSRKLSTRIVESEITLRDSRAEALYRSESYDGNLMIFWTYWNPEKAGRSRARWSYNPTDQIPGWRRLVRGNVKLVRVEGDHLSMLKGAGAKTMVNEMVETILHLRER